MQRSHKLVTMELDSKELYQQGSSINRKKDIRSKMNAESVQYSTVLRAFFCFSDILLIL